MCLDVFAEVVTSHESLATFMTLKSLLSRVSAKVALKLIGTSEPFPTEQPWTHKRPFSSVPAKMSSQMRRLTIDFSTANVVADMLFLLW